MHLFDELVNEFGLCLIAKILDQIDSFLSEFSVVKDLTPPLVVVSYEHWIAELLLNLLLSLFNLD